MLSDTIKAFEILRQDLEAALKKDPELGECSVGDKHGQDFGKEDGKFKFKVYHEKGAYFPSISYYTLTTDSMQIVEYLDLKQKEKERFINILIQQIKDQSI